MKFKQLIRESERELIGKYSTKGNRYYFEIYDSHDGTFDIDEYSNGRISGAYHNIKEKDLKNTIKRIVDDGKNDGINYYGITQLGA
jgi:hypothetical protein